MKPVEKLSGLLFISYQDVQSSHYEAGKSALNLQKYISSMNDIYIMTLKGIIKLTLCRSSS